MKEQPATPVLSFSANAWAKVCFMRDIGPTEVSGMCITSPDNLFHVEDFLLIKQESSSALTEIDGEALADWMLDRLDEGLSYERCGRIWLHTHPPGMSPSPSGTDERTFREIFGRYPWAAMAIVAKDGRVSCRLQVNCGLHVRVECTHEVRSTEYLRAVAPEAWKAEYESLVTKKVYQSYTSSHSSYPYQGDWRQRWADDGYGQGEDGVWRKDFKPPTQSRPHYRQGKYITIKHPKYGWVPKDEIARLDAGMHRMPTWSEFDRLVPSKQYPTGLQVHEDQAPQFGFCEADVTALYMPHDAKFNTRFEALRYLILKVQDEDDAAVKKWWEERQADSANVIALPEDDGPTDGEIEKLVEEVACGRIIGGSEAAILGFDEDDIKFSEDTDGLDRSEAVYVCFGEYTKLTELVEDDKSDDPNYEKNYVDAFGADVSYYGD